MALSAARNTKQVGPTNVVLRKLNLPQKGSTTIYAGSLVVIDAGYAAPGSTATGKLAVGRAVATSVNAGADGAATLDVEQGAFVWANSGTDAVVAADLGKLVYIEDDQTVSHTSTGKSVAGRFVGFEGTACIVQTFLGIA